MSLPRIAIPVPTLADHEYNQRSWPLYAEAVRLAGGSPVAVELGQTSRQVTEIADSCHGVLLPGSGADVDPARYGQDRIAECAPADLARELVDIELLDHAHLRRKPILGICFGAQMLNVWRGGALVQDLMVVPVNHRAGRSVAVAHPVAVPVDSLLAGIVGVHAAEWVPDGDGFIRIPVNSSHHQAVAIPGQGLRIVARCPGDGVIEAIEDAGAWRLVLGVQWHPERVYDRSAAARALFARLLREADGV